MEEFKNEFKSAKKLFQSPQVGYIFASMLEGLTPNKVFVDDINNPTLALSWDKWSCFFFGGEIEETKAAKNTIDFFKTHFLNEKKRKDIGIFKIYFPSEIWEKALVENLQEFNPLVLNRVLYQHKLKGIPQNNKKEFIVREINEEILDNSSLGNLNAVTEEISGMWGSVDNFRKNGFGTCALEGNDIICWCTAEYMSQGLCGIGIETVEESQRKGVATATTLAFLNKCSQLGFKPYWDCWAENKPSVRVAEKTGFEKVVDYKVVLLDFLPDD